MNAKIKLNTGLYKLKGTGLIDLAMLTYVGEIDGAGRYAVLLTNGEAMSVNDSKAPRRELVEAWERSRVIL